MLLMMSTLTQTTIRGLLACTLLLPFCSCSQQPESEQSTGAKEDAQASAEDQSLSAIVQCDTGTFVIRLRPDLSPLSVANFCNLVDRGFYHGKEVANSNSISRSIGYAPPAPTYRLPAEYSSEIFFDNPGIVAWTFEDTQEGTEQFVPHPTRFFITIAPQKRWNLQYAPFGTIEEGQDAVKLMQKGDWIRSVKIVGDPTWLLERYPDQIEEWDRSLDRAGHLRAGTKDTRGTLPKLPLNSN